MIKKGEVLVCVDNTIFASSPIILDLTCNKKYTMIEWMDSDHHMLFVKNDSNEMRPYTVDHFITLMEYRKLKLDKICSKRVMK
jgi:hypothetical protein